MDKCFTGLDFLAIALLYYSWDYWKLWWVEVIAGIVILGYCSSYLWNSKIQYEPVDEMTKEHECRAQAATYNGLCVILSIIGLLCMCSKPIRSLLFSFELSWPFLFLLLGVLQILEYFVFLWIESSGDAIE